MGKVWAGVVAVGLVLFAMTFGVVNIAPTEAGVTVNKVAGVVSPQPLSVGYHVFNRWVTDVEVYTIAVRTFPSDKAGMFADAKEGSKYVLSLKTRDGQRVDVDLSVLYSLKATEVPGLHTQVGRSYEDQVLLSQVRSEARIAIGKYSAEELYDGNVRDKIQSELTARMQRALADYPAILIQDALIRDFDFEDAFETKIEEKKLAAQQVEINKNLALAQEENAKQQEAKARGDKLMAIQAAEGRAESVKKEADAERYRLEQQAAGNLAIAQAEAEGKRLQAEALGSGENVVALEFARQIPSKLQIWGIPTGSSSTSIMDLSGVLGGMLRPKE